MPTIGSLGNARAASQTSKAILAHSPEQLERELQLDSAERGFQSVPLPPWQFPPTYFPLSTLVVYAVFLSTPII